jgi:hypothetical protein
MHSTDKVSNMPGFTAETSLYDTSKRYRAATEHVPLTTGVTPAACCSGCADICEMYPQSYGCNKCWWNCNRDC